MTLVSFWLEVIPIHEVHVEVDLFQFNLGIWKSRREFKKSFSVRVPFGLAYF
jgi:hypothetical protein